MMLGRVALTQNIIIHETDDHKELQKHFHSANVGSWLSINENVENKDVLDLLKGGVR